MVKIDLLVNHPQHTKALATLWHQLIGQRWTPQIDFAEIESWFDECLNKEIPLAFIALINDKPIAACSLQYEDGIHSELTPWLGDLIVDPHYQKQGIGRLLIEKTKQKAHDLGYDTIYLFTLDKSLIPYYSSLGWEVMGESEYKDRPVTVMKSKTHI